MRKLAILAGLAGASITALTTSQVLAFAGGAQSVTARFTPEVQAVQYNGYRPRYCNPPPYGSGGPYRCSPDGSPIDSQGWRYFNGYWHNGCFNLDYLSDSAACSVGPSRR
jgi:hypothetical protein